MSGHAIDTSSLPPLWREAFRRDREGLAPQLADPLPERRLARLLAAFIGLGLLFLVLPGTLIGVWNLIGISSNRSAASVSTAWIQAHGHAQLFGWVGTFIIGISLYAVPKFRGGALRSLAAGWAMFVLWAAALTVRWASGVRGWQWQPAWVFSAAAELAVAVLLIWQCSASGRSFRRTELWNQLVFAGYAGLVAVLGWQAVLIWNGAGSAMLPERPNGLLLWLALWAAFFPAVWGFSTRFLPAFLGFERPRQPSAQAGLLLLGAGAILALADQERVAAVAVALAALLACHSLRIFEPSSRPAKVAGVDPRYPWFVRVSFAWLAVSALIAIVGNSKGLTGASRHAFTVGFLAGLIFSIGPRLLPSFLNSRELWSPRLSLTAMVVLNAGCLLRVASEPPAYAGLLPWAWGVLPVSAILELTAVLLFAWNIGRTLLSPMPAWIETRVVTADLPLYWSITAYPETRRLLIESGLSTLEGVRTVPRSLTLREAAEADSVRAEELVARLRAYFERRLARTLKLKKA